jgi:hypothetical protein
MIDAKTLLNYSECSRKAELFLKEIDLLLKLQQSLVGRTSFKFGVIKKFDKPFFVSRETFRINRERKYDLDYITSDEYIDVIGDEVFANIVSILKELGYITYLRKIGSHDGLLFELNIKW